MKRPPAGLKKVVSGGQTGVDRGALDAALAAHFPCGGYCPAGRRAEDGVIPSHYPLVETESTDYEERTRRNVEGSDGTLIISGGTLRGGTLLTALIAGELGKPCLVWDLREPSDRDELLFWLTTCEIETLNVAGPRQSSQPGVQEQAQDLVAGLLRQCGSEKSASSNL